LRKLAEQQSTGRSLTRKKKSCIRSQVILKGDLRIRRARIHVKKSLWTLKVGCGIQKKPGGRGSRKKAKQAKRFEDSVETFCPSHEGGKKIIVLPLKGPHEKKLSKKPAANLPSKGEGVYDGRGLQRSFTETRIEIRKHLSRNSNFLEIIFEREPPEKDQQFKGEMLVTRGEGKAVSWNIPEDFETGFRTAVTSGGRDSKRGKGDWAVKGKPQSKDTREAHEFGVCKAGGGKPRAVKNSGQTPKISGEEPEGKSP